MVASLLQVSAVNEQQASQLIHSRNLASGLSLVHAHVALVDLFMQLEENLHCQQSPSYVHVYT